MVSRQRFTLWAVALGMLWPLAGFAASPTKSSSQAQVKEADSSTEIEGLKKALAALERKLEVQMSSLSYLSINLVPIGSIMAYAGPVDEKHPLSPDWHLCDGQELATKGEYSTLFQAIGYAWGGKEDKFKLPDLTGRFLRGVDLGHGHDPDAAAREAVASGGQRGDAVATTQGDSLKKHRHPAGVSFSGTRLMFTSVTHREVPGVEWPWGIPTQKQTSDHDYGRQFSTALNGEPAGIHREPLGSLLSGQVTVQDEGDKETRPSNVSVHWIIRVK